MQTQEDVVGLITNRILVKNEIQHILDECKLALDEINEKNLSEFSNVERALKYLENI